MTVSIEHQADLADGYERESVYVEMQDGCRIAVDVLHPAKGGRRRSGRGFVPLIRDWTPLANSLTPPWWMCLVRIAEKVACW